jgi:DNA-binding MarR family transcriptional regulator
LADAEQISRPTMSAHIKRLETAGWLARSDDAQDGRRSGLAVTPSGARKLETIQRLRNDWLSARLALLTDAERQRLADAAAPLLRLVSIDA